MLYEVYYAAVLHTITIYQFESLQPTNSLQITEPIS